MTAEHPGRTALRHLDEVLAQKPKKDDHALSAATRCLTAFRREVIASQGGTGASGEERERLARLNAVISVVVALHFPLGDAPWDEAEKLRGWLADLVAEYEQADTA